jgi:hypothetical protein
MQRLFEEKMREGVPEVVADDMQKRQLEQLHSRIKEKQRIDIEKEALRVTTILEKKRMKQEIQDLILKKFGSKQATPLREAVS